MMEKLKYVLLFVLGVLSFTSCYKDLGIMITRKLIK